MRLFNQAFRRNVALTIFTQVIIAVSFVIMLGVLSRVFPKYDMGLYGNYRSLLQFLFFLYTFGMDIGLARYLGLAEGKPEEQDEHFSTVLLLFFVMLIGSTLCLYLFSGFISRRFLGESTQLFHYTILGLALLGAFKIVYTFYQGHRRMVAANMLQLVILGGGNLMVTLFLWLGLIQSMDTIILLLSLVMALAIPPLVHVSMKHFVWRFRFREMIRYSFPRAPHIFLSGIILTFGILLASLFYSYETAGDFTVTTRLFRIMGMAAYGFNMVLLPGVAAMIGAGRQKELADSLTRYGDLVVWLGVVGLYLCYVGSPIAIQLWLTDAYASSIPILRIFSFSIPFYLYYLMFRSTIHGMDEKPIQLYIDLAAFFFLILTFFLLSRFWNNPVSVIAVSMAVAFVVTGVCSLWYLKSRAHVRMYPARWLAELALVLPAVFLAHVSVFLSLACFIAGQGYFLYRLFPDMFSGILRRVSGKHTSLL